MAGYSGDIRRVEGQVAKTADQGAERLSDPVKALNAKLKRLRRTIIETACEAGEGHIPSALSILDILYVLYDSVMRYDPLHPKWDVRDRFVLSKGHGCLALYTVLAEHEFIPQALLHDFCQPWSALMGHPSHLIPGVEVSTGSLGHGLPVAVGMAAALKLLNNPAKIYCLVGDGECLEGSVWEAAAHAASLQLDNLVCIVDENLSSKRSVPTHSLAQKFMAFGWIAEICSGHSHYDLNRALKQTYHRKPSCVVAMTTKGYGVPEMEREPQVWHHRAPTRAELPALLETLR